MDNHKFYWDIPVIVNSFPVVMVGYSYKEVTMILLRNKGTGEVLGAISEEDLQFLKDQLVEETEEDVDYYLNRDELEILKVRGASQALAILLEKGFGDGDELEVEWTRA